VVHLPFKLQRIGVGCACAHDALPALFADVSVFVLRANLFLFAEKRVYADDESARMMSNFQVHARCVMRDA